MYKRQGLERSREVARRLGLGKPAPLVVTVTGTNGKGSTCAFLASLIGVQGPRAVSYTHLDVYKRQPPMSVARVLPLARTLPR